MNKLFISQIILVFVLLMSCENENVIDDITITEINGYIQKGPYLNGTSLCLYELSDDFNPTGKIFTTQIHDNSGNFEINNINLISEYIELKADGFYYNEVADENSAAQLTLYAISDIADKKSLNVNVLSHLERGRIKCLLPLGMTLGEAKAQAQSEILKIFEIDKPDMSNFEFLDITKSGEDNAILLAVSVILQGKMSVSELSELLANLNTDICEDGKLDSETIGTQLINNANIIDPQIIRTNLENRYESMGMDVIIPDFEKYITQFIDSSSFEYTNAIEYPEIGEFGINLLADTVTTYPAGRYSLSASLPESTCLTVKASGTGFEINHNPYDVSNIGWEIIDQEGEYTSEKTGQIDLMLILYPSITDSMSTTSEPNRFELQVYENNAIEATWSKYITITDYDQ